MFEMTVRLDREIGVRCRVLLVATTWQHTKHEDDDDQGKTAGGSDPAGSPRRARTCCSGRAPLFAEYGVPRSLSGSRTATPRSHRPPVSVGQSRNSWALEKTEPPRVACAKARGRRERFGSPLIRHP